MNAWHHEKGLFVFVFFLISILSLAPLAANAFLAVRAHQLLDLRGDEGTAVSHLLGLIEGAAFLAAVSAILIVALCLRLRAACNHFEEHQHAMDALEAALLADITSTKTETKHLPKERRDSPHVVAADSVLPLNNGHHRALS